MTRSRPVVGRIVDLPVPPLQTDIDADIKRQCEALGITDLRNTQSITEQAYTALVRFCREQKRAPQLAELQVALAPLNRNQVSTALNRLQAAGRVMRLGNKPHHYLPRVV